MWDDTGPRRETTVAIANAAPFAAQRRNSLEELVDAGHMRMVRGSRVRAGRRCARGHLRSARCRPTTSSSRSPRGGERRHRRSRRHTFDWLCEQGHVGLERVAKARRDPAIVAPVTRRSRCSAAIYARLKGDVSVLHAARENLLLPVDLFHAPTGTVIEVDGAGALHLVPARDARPLPGRRAVGFDLDEYPALCRKWARQRPLSRGLPAKGFGFGGVQRERAYHDALLDLAAPAMGHPRVVRIAAPDGDGAAAYARHREALLPLAVS